MKKYLALIIISIVLIYSCKTNTVGPAENLHSVHWNDISINQVYYDSLEIICQNQIVLTGQPVERIVLFELENEIFVPVDTTIPSYTKEGDRFVLHFKFEKQVAKEILHYTFKLRYIINAHKSFEVENTHLMIRYPYESAQLYLTADEVWNQYEITFQDIDFNEDYMFFHPASAYGLYQYSFYSELSDELMGYVGGDCIASDSIYVFADIMHSDIDRYNLILNRVDLRFDVDMLNISHISGLEVYQGFVYVYYLLYEYGGPSLAKFDLNGTLISSFPFSGNGYYLTIDADIAYSTDQSNLYRYNLITNSNLPEKPAPVYHGGGIRIYNDHLYFVDWDKRAIGYIPLSEVQ